MFLKKILFAHPAYFIALGFGSGLSRYAPGTVATLWGWVLFLMFGNAFTFDFWIIFLLASIFVGVWSCELTSKKLNKDDPSEIVIDEIVAFWIILAFLPSSNEPMSENILIGLPEWFIQLLAFILFRLFDILKPPPISWIDNNIKGGMGIMLDDLAAAGFTLFTISVFLKVYVSGVFI